MTDMMTVNARLVWFHREMRKKLSLPENRKKPDWRLLGARDILERIEEELQELSVKLNKEKRVPHDVIAECADVANMAFMLADLMKVTSAQAQSAQREGHVPVVVPDPDAESGPLPKKSKPLKKPE